MGGVSTASALSHAVTAGEECALCGGPCREPFRLPPIHAKYPFMSRAQIEATWPPVQGPERTRRRREDRMHRPSEDR